MWDLKNITLSGAAHRAQGGGGAGGGGGGGGIQTHENKKNSSLAGQKTQFKATNKRNVKETNICLLMRRSGTVGS